MKDFLASSFLFFGSLFMLIGALGVLRMPDIFTRMHAATKTSSFGVSFILIGAIFHFQDIAVITRALATILFVFTTAPVAALMLGRVAYLLKVPFAKETAYDEWNDFHAISKTKSKLFENSKRTRSEVENI